MLFFTVVGEPVFKHLEHLPSVLGLLFNSTHSHLNEIFKTLSKRKCYIKSSLYLRSFKIIDLNCFFPDPVRFVMGLRTSPSVSKSPWVSTCLPSNLAPMWYTAVRFVMCLGQRLNHLWHLPRGLPTVVVTHRWSETLHKVLWEKHHVDLVSLWTICLLAAWLGEWGALARESGTGRQRSWRP